ncbi:hypothetical protein DICPUDRAFT_92264 [Dictyostelium purpureum]|uniref:Cytochrome b5 heme-binding domain-containing protein n=1 Tax=Dictyostelium purpureum TaxID=5786 RepID=F0ZPA3_DICPU|nr:uncharacterized protein DICPUDRAFT_92264 [Dictyostelium purpureum]EGC34240.1 hypothetical protein DICPUDRAFT_92264 [Dictyostelium purpureum]|eukprot:XP_003289250.1 hypothetical protein DICPUDRAFT_92264 [Dictyostelium purpureum]
MFDIPEELVYAVLIIIILYLVKVIASPKEVVVAKPKPKPQYEKRDYTLEELKQYNGTDETKPIFIAIKGKIYDVTAKSSTYGPGGAYNTFSGNDATICLAKSSFEDADINKKWTEKSLEELPEEHKESLNGWINFFSERYILVGNVKQE